MFPFQSPVLLLTASHFQRLLFFFWGGEVSPILLNTTLTALLFNPFAQLFLNLGTLLFVLQCLSNCAVSPKLNEASHCLLQIPSSSLSFVFCCYVSPIEPTLEICCVIRAGLPCNTDRDPLACLVWFTLGLGLIAVLAYILEWIDSGTDAPTTKTMS